MQILIAAVLVLSTSLAQSQETPTALDTFDACWRAVPVHFYDPNLRGVNWDLVRERHRPAAERATGGRELHDVLRRMIAELGTSHTSIVEPKVHRLLGAELDDRAATTYGMLIEETEPYRFFVRALYEGGPGERAGLRVGDRIVLVDGITPSRSPSVAYAGYDPALPGPPLYLLVADSRQEHLRLCVQRTPDEVSRHDVVMEPAVMNGVDAAQNSVRIIERDGVRLGYLHVWFCSRGVSDVVENALAKTLADCDGLVFDLRGRGGRTDVLKTLLSYFYEWRSETGDLTPPLWNKPAVFLTDRRTRSAKEIMAHAIRTDELGVLVGERTEGAVLGGEYFRLPDGAFLQLPVVEITTRGVRLEGTGIEPHHPVTMDIPFLAGRDPILEEGCAVAVALARARAGVE